MRIDDFRDVQSHLIAVIGPMIERDILQSKYNVIVISELIASRFSEVSFSDVRRSLNHKFYNL
jgi:hypothetical protein